MTELNNVHNKYDSCPYCDGVVSIDIRGNGVGFNWLAVTCQRCGFAVSIPLNAPKLITRERQWEQASTIWKRMGVLFRNYTTMEEWTNETNYRIR